MLKKIKLTALLASLADNLNETTAPNFEYLPSVAKDRVLLLGSLAFLGRELLDDEEEEETSDEENADDE